LINSVPSNQYYNEVHCGRGEDLEGKGDAPSKS